MDTPDDLYNQILTSGPSPGTLFHVLSELKAAGQQKRVIQEALKALEVYPKDIQIRKLLAETYFEAGLIIQAEAELEKVTVHIGDLISAYKLKAEIYCKQGRQELAVESLKLYLAHKPDDQEAINFLGTLQPGEKTPPAAEEVAAPDEEIVGVEPDTPEGVEPTAIATPTLAEIYFNQGQIQEAINTYEKIVTRNPDDEHSRDRYEALKKLALEEKVVEDKEAIGVDKLKQKKEKMISILDSWLITIRERYKTTTSV